MTLTIRKLKERHFVPATWAEGEKKLLARAIKFRRILCRFGAHPPLQPRIASATRFTRGEYCSVNRELFSSSGTGGEAIVNEPFHRTRAMSFPRCNNYCAVPFCAKLRRPAHIFRVRNKNRRFTTVRAIRPCSRGLSIIARSVCDFIANFVASSRPKAKSDPRLG